MNKTEALHLLRTEMRNHGLHGWIAELDNSRRRFGVCRLGKKIISLSTPLVEANDLYAVHQTILHEVAHALVGPGHGHDDVWLRKARMIGYNGKTTCGEETVSVAPKWVGTCPSCNWKIGRNRLTKTMRQRGGCIKCKTFTLLRWHENFAGERVKC